MSALEIRQFACLSDNYGYLVHDRDSGETACIDTPDPQVILREAQVRIVEDFVHALDPLNLQAIEEGKGANVKPLAQQMLMGQGKTAVITPLLCLLLANGEQLPIVLLPRVDTTARANHNGKAEPPPIPSNAANLPPWTKSNFLAVVEESHA